MKKACCLLLCILLCVLASACRGEAKTSSVPQVLTSDKSETAVKYPNDQKHTVSYNYEEAVALADAVVCARFEQQETQTSDGGCKAFFTPVEVLCGEIRSESLCVTLSSAQLESRPSLLLDGIFTLEKGKEYLIALAATEDGYRSTLENGCLETAEKHGLRWVGPIAVGSVSIHLYDQLSVYTAELQKKFPTHADYLKNQEQAQENRSPFPALCETDLVVFVSRPNIGNIDHPRKAPDPNPEDYGRDDLERKYEVTTTVYEVLYGETEKTDIKIVKSWGSEESLLGDEILFLKKVGDFYYLSSFHLRSTRNADQKDLVVEYIRSETKGGEAE